MKNFHLAPFWLYPNPQALYQISAFTAATGTKAADM